MKTPLEKKIRLLVVDDHPLMQEGLRSALAKYQFLEIAGEASNGEEAVRKAKELMADVVLMDINMPRMNGLEATELMRREAPQAKVLILTAHKNPEYVRKIIHCGARGYLLKDASGQELAHAIELVADGRTYFSPEVSGEALDFCFKQADHPGQAHSTALSERELEVLKLVARGCSTKEIAPQLKITCRTVETYRERIMSKLGIHNIAGLTRFAISEGLIDLD
jgi:two-component system nitrate/nitrite response regulator NarL